MEPVDKRQIGPVTTAATAGAAASGLIAWGLKQFGVEMEPEVQGYLAILFVVVAGWIVRPHGKRVAS